MSMGRLASNGTLLHGLEVATVLFIQLSLSVKFRHFKWNAFYMNITKFLFKSFIVFCGV